jgi:hypothetical protein
MSVYDLVFCLFIVLINLDKDRDKELEVCNNFNKNKIFSLKWFLNTKRYNKQGEVFSILCLSN